MAIERKVVDPEKQSQDDTFMKHAVAQSLTSPCKKIKFHLLLKTTNVSIGTIPINLAWNLT